MNKNSFQKTIIIVVLIAVIIGAVIAYFLITRNENLVPSPNQKQSTKLSEDDGSKLVDKKLDIYFLAVGQGDSAIIVLPDGKTMMIDSGSSAGGELTTVTNKLDDLQITCLDYVLLTHTDSDHCTYLDDAISHVEQVKTAYLPKIKSKNYDLGLSSDYKSKTTVAYDNVVKAVKNATYTENEETKSTEICFTCGEIAINGEGYTITMYCRSDDYYTSMSASDSLDINDVSPIVVIEFNGRKILFTGDSNNSETHTGANGSSEKNFLNIMEEKGVKDEDFDADILKVPHHGSSGACGSDFLDFIDVEYAVVSVGGTANASAESYNLYTERSYTLADKHHVIKPNSSYGHPTAAVCAESGRLANANVEHTYYTWFNGTVKCNIDGTGKITMSADYMAVEGDSEIIYQDARPYYSNIASQMITTIPNINKYLYAVV